MKSDVYFTDMRASAKESFTKKISRLMLTSGISDIISKRDMVAIKIHFGEMGNTAFIKPVYIREIVKTIKKMDAKPFLTDANTLYAGTRSNTVDHIITAIQNGFAISVVEAPIIIADGLRGKSETLLNINKKNNVFAYIGKEITESDALLSVAHFKGHELSGFGGTIKNIGMGCASRRGKLDQHSSVNPQVNKKKCVGCKECNKHCSQNAINIHSNKAKIEFEKCIGCGECIVICPNKAIEIIWNRSIPTFMKKMVEYTKSILLDKEKKSIFINFITDVSPGCDCHPANDAPIIKDIGILCSKDPVAIDQASVDLVNNEPAIAGTAIKKNMSAGDDKFKGLYPKIDWDLQLKYAEALDVGNRKYKLIKI